MRERRRRRLMRGAKRRTRRQRNGQRAQRRRAERWGEQQRAATSSNEQQKKTRTRAAVETTLWVSARVVWRRRQGPLGALAGARSLALWDTHRPSPREVDQWRRSGDSGGSRTEQPAPRPPHSSLEAPRVPSPPLLSPQLATSRGMPSPPPLLLCALSKPRVQRSL